MAQITITGVYCTVTLSSPDEDGDYSWKAACGEVADCYRPIDEAIMLAEQHADFRWTRGVVALHVNGSPGKSDLADR